MTALLFAAAPAIGADWTHFCGDARRTSTATTATLRLDHIAWQFLPADDEQFVPSATPIVADGRVYLSVRVSPDDFDPFHRIIAVDEITGESLWWADLPADELDSWSSPAFDERNDTIIMPTDRTLTAIDAESGDIRWNCDLHNAVVNASPAISTDLVEGGTPTNRVFISDYRPFGNGRLYAINVDPFHGANNPYEPGEIAWEVRISKLSGNSPAYADGVVFVTSNSGRVYAFDASSGEMKWESQTATNGIFGGAAIIDGALFAATYDFYGSGNNSELLKIDACTGEFIWTVPCHRTAATPIAGIDGRIYLSCGIDGFSSAPRVQAFADHGDHAEALWDTYADSDGGLIVGGWSYQPTRVDGFLFAGVPGEDSLVDPYVRLSVLDLGKNPSDTGFVFASADGVGGAPAISRGRIYSVGVDGLMKFVSRELGDLDCDGFVSFNDIDPFLEAVIDRGAYAVHFPDCDVLQGDINGDRRVNFLDIDPFVELLSK